MSCPQQAGSRLRPDDGNNICLARSVGRTLLVSIVIITTAPCVSLLTACSCARLLGLTRRMNIPCTYIKKVGLKVAHILDYRA